VQNDFACITTHSVLTTKVVDLPICYDVVIFFWPTESDIVVILDIINLFGETSGLKTNVHKSNVIPIQCTSSDISTI